MPSFRPVPILLLMIVCCTRSERGKAQDVAAPGGAAALATSLRSGDVDVRRAGANALLASTRVVQRSLLPVTIDLLKSEKDGQVRLAILDVMTAMGRDAEPAVPVLVHTLRTDFGGQGKEASHQDYRSALALAAIGKPAVEGLRSLLKERKESVRAEVVMALGRIGTDASSSIPDLIPLFHDTSERIRREATQSLGKMGQAAVEPLLVAVASANTQVRSCAMESLGTIKPANEKTNQAILKCSIDKEPRVRAAAVRSAAKLALASEVMRPILLENLRHPDEGVRRAVIDSLVARKQLLAELSPEIEPLLEHENPRVARHAAFLLCKLGISEASTLIKAFSSQKVMIDPVAEELAKIGPPVVPLLLTALKNPDPRIRRGAALTLGQIRPLGSSTARILSEGLYDPDQEVKLANLVAIRHLGARAGEAAPAIRSLLKHESVAIRRLAMEILALATTRDDQLLADLIPLLDDPDTGVQRQAIEIIRGLGPLGRKATPVILGKFKHVDPEVRLAAAEFIGSLAPAHSAAVPELMTLLADPSPKLRVIAAQTLGKMGKDAQPALAQLGQLTTAPEAEVREAAALALGSMELDPFVLRPHVSQALKDAAPEVRRAGMRSIQRLGPQASVFLPDLLPLLDNKENQRGVERLLRQLERASLDKRTLPDLIKLLDHERTPIRLQAIKFVGLAADQPTEVMSALDRLLGDQNPEVRNQAKATIERMKSSPGPAKH